MLEKRVCRGLGGPKLIFEGGFTKQTFRRASFSFCGHLWFLSRFARRGDYRFVLNLSPSIHGNVPLSLGHFDGLISCPKPGPTYFRTFQTLRVCLSGVKHEKSAENDGKTRLPGTGWAETYFWGWFQKTNFVGRIIFVLRVPLVFEPFPLWERIRVLWYPCQPFIHSNVPTQMGHFDGSILPQKLVGTYNMWN